MEKKTALRDGVYSYDEGAQQHNRSDRVAVWDAWPELRPVC